MPALVRSSVPLILFLSRFGALAGASTWSSPALAHVKWFAPYIVDATPRPVAATLTDVWFWSGVALVTTFFLLARGLERTPAGALILDLMDRAAAPLSSRLDDLVRAVIGAFFVAIFSIGGTYLTPDLKAPSETIAWMQLVIAVCVFWRATMPVAAAGIVGLWVLALRDYDVFHLLDYLALGLGAAAYLVLASTPNADLSRYRFDVLRVAVAVSLMWSSLEKFAYPEWFHPLVVEKPYLTFGLARDAFIPMAGVAEFTLGFGLLWTPMVRRLSAVALFIIFNAAVYPFGRIDLVGHALIMAMILVVAADTRRDGPITAPLTAALARVPTSLTAAFVALSIGYWGLHAALYDTPADRPTPAYAATHTTDPDHPHPATLAGGGTKQ